MMKKSQGYQRYHASKARGNKYSNGNTKYQDHEIFLLDWRSYSLWRKNKYLMLQGGSVIPRAADCRTADQINRPDTSDQND